MHTVQTPLQTDAEIQPRSPWVAPVLEIHTHGEAAGGGFIADDGYLTDS
ncbi:hypothetical protein [Brevundimonas sp.]|nr:hypothetical protein [Brevundimonas sp.]MDZ4365400.1 hypothetical protein [Brevundimonas sp.]